MPLLRRSAVLALCLLGAAAALADFDAALLEEGYSFRSIGPYRGGRSAAVAGVAGDPLTWYFGGTGGGVFKSTDAGQSWSNVSDGFFGGSIGAVAVSEWDPNVIYVGGGEKTVRGNVSHGYGMFKSVDAGKTWTSVGLEDGRHITRIRIHPRNPDLVYAAVLGHLYGPNEQRGLYRSRDGGSTWERILFVSADAGCVDLAMDPNNARILYASFWRVRRQPHRLDSGGEGSSIWKSVDGGDSWEEITRKPGLPSGVIGINCVTVSGANSDRIWAIIEADEGGVFRSDDGGEKWRRVNDDRSLRQRAWYYTRIYADPKDEDSVYVLNVRFWKSKDGGESFDSIRTPHGDHHDLWIDPHDPSHFVVGDDGGAQVTLDGGENFTTYYNQPTAQFYRVTTDDSFPYRIYGAQQDNSTVRIRHRSDGSGISSSDWEPTAGGESGWIAPDPRDNDIVYGGSYGGYLTRLNHRTREVRSVNVWPDNPMGHGAEGAVERFQWNFPILFSRHEPGLLYAASQHLWATRDEGQSWQRISDDLTRNDPTRLVSSGGPITQDNTSVEYYCTIFSVAEDLFRSGAIWAGSDDGLLHVTLDGGANWTDVTPKGLPEWTQINGLEADPFVEGGLYLAATSYKSDDFAPYLFHTTDFGSSWKKIVKGIDPLHFTRAIRADPVRQGLLFAGTESGLYVSFDSGAQWHALQLNLPIVPITDLAIQENDLVVATQGRSFWVLDDLTVLQQWRDEQAEAPFTLYAPRDTWRMNGRGVWGGDPFAGENHPRGALIHYRFASPPDSNAVKLEVLDAAGELVRSYTPDAEESDDQLPLEEGMNRLVWNLRYPDAEDFKGMILWNGGTDGPRALPGEYQVRLTVGELSATESFTLKVDPRSTASAEDLKAQFDFLIAGRDRMSEIHESIQAIRDMRADIKSVEIPEDAEELEELAKGMLERLDGIEKALYQTKNQSRQDPLNFPIRLNDKMASVLDDVSTGDFPPTSQAMEVWERLSAQAQEQLDAFAQLKADDVPRFNAAVRAAELPALKAQ